MIHEYAVDPDAVFQKDGFWSLLKDFGIAQGRVIVECPEKAGRKQLEQSLCHAHSEFGEVAFLRLTECWAELKERKGLINRKHSCFDAVARNWLQRIRPEHVPDSFHGLLTNERDEQMTDVLSKQDIDLGDVRWNAETQKIVPRTSEALAECVALLGKVSREILFIDPYFSDDKKWREFLVSTLNACRAQDLHFRRIEVHTSEFNNRDRDRLST